MQPKTNGEGDWELDIAFAYRVEGQEYLARQQLLWFYAIPFSAADGEAGFLKAGCGDIQRLIGLANLSDSRRRAVDARSPYTTGQPATVHFNPSNPSDAVLKPGLVLGQDLSYGELTVILSIVFLWIGGGSAFLLGWSKHSPDTHPEKASKEPQIGLGASETEPSHAFTAALRSLGIEAESGNSWDADYDHHWEINISEGPIATIDLGDLDGILETEFHIPDHRIQASSPNIRLYSVRKKTFPVFGRIRRVVWKGAAFDSRLLEVLNHDHSLGEPYVFQRSHRITLDRDHNVGLSLFATGNRLRHSCGAATCRSLAIYKVHLCRQFELHNEKGEVLAWSRHLRKQVLAYMF